MILLDGVMKVIKNNYKVKKLHGLSGNRSRTNETREEIKKNQFNTTAVNEVESNKKYKERD